MLSRRTTFLPCTDHVSLYSYCQCPAAAQGGRWLRDGKPWDEFSYDILQKWGRSPLTGGGRTRGAPSDGILVSGPVGVFMCGLAGHFTVTHAGECVSV